MARLKDREKALALRIEKEMSYKQIKEILGVSKSTLSYWLRNYPLSEKRIKELRKEGARNSEQAIEKYRATMRLKKEKRHRDTYEAQKREILPLSKRELYLAGLMLYWGEGTKCHMYALEISNTDPAVVTFFIYWLTKILKAPRDRIRVQIQLYKDMNVKKELQYWSETLNIPINQFVKPQIKKNSSKRINHKGSFGHGTCLARVGGVKLAEKIHMGIKVIGDKYK